MSKIPAVSYIRMSSSKQEASPDQQRKAISEYAAGRDYEIVEEYFDSGVSGDDTEKRVAFQRMIVDAQAGKFKVILCWDQDRFGRGFGCRGPCSSRAVLWRSTRMLSKSRSVFCAETEVVMRCKSRTGSVFKNVRVMLTS